MTNALLILLSLSIQIIQVHLQSTTCMTNIVEHAGLEAMRPRLSSSRSDAGNLAATCASTSARTASSRPAPTVRGRAQEVLRSASLNCLCIE